MTISKDQHREDLIQELIKQVQGGTVPVPIGTVVPEEALNDSYTADDYLRLLANVALFGTHRWYMGHVDLPDETKLDWGGLQCRRHWIDFDGNLSHPDLDAIRKEINECITAATVAAISAGLLTGNIAAATAAFKASFYACLKLKGIGWASEIAFWITSEEKRGDWHWCAKASKP